MVIWSRYHKLFLVALICVTTFQFAFSQAEVFFYQPRDLTAIGDSIREHHLIGRYSTDTGYAEQIQLGDGLAIVGDSLNVVATPPSIITPSQITSDQDDYNPTGFGTANIIRVSGNNGIRAITSLAAQSDGEEKCFINVGSYPIYFPAQHPDGTAANRIIGEKDYMLFPGKSCKLIYDNTSSRWRLNGSYDKYDGRGVHYSKSASSVTSADHDDLTFTTANSGTFTAVAASSALPAAWRHNTNASSNALTSIYAPKSLDFTVLGQAHIYFETSISVATLSDATDTYTVYCSLIDFVTAPTTTNNMIGIRYSHGINSGKFEGYSEDNGGSESTVDLGVTVSTSRVYKLRIEIDKAKTEARFYIDDAYAGRVTANMPASNAVGADVSLLKSAGTTSRTLLVHNFQCGAYYP
jgi:hypothetical protein